MSQLAAALFTKTQKQVLGLLYSQPHRSYYTNEILRSTGMGVATIKRELDRMVAAGVLTLRLQGNQRHYQANPNCQIYQELLSIVRKTLGAVDVLRETLEPLGDRVTRAFIFGSLASGTESTYSDIDLMMVGEVSFAEAVNAIYPAQESLTREINPRVYRNDEWNQLVREKDVFILDVLSKPCLDVIGRFDEP